MKQWRLLCALASLTILCSCASQQATKTPAGSSTVPSTIKVQTEDLPCADINRDGPLQINYPQESLYRNGAALPKQEGLACLDVLSTWLKGQSQTRWQITVGGEAGYGFDPLALAGKRQELLQRFLERKGLDTQALQWRAIGDSGTQLQFVEVTGSP